MTETALSTSGLGRTFGGLVALQGVQFDVEANDVVGIIGPNGAGKTTLLNLICGFTRPTAGAVQMFGRDRARTSPVARSRLGMTRTFQSPQVFGNQTVGTNVLMGTFRWDPHQLRNAARRSERRRQRAFTLEALDEVGLSHRVDDLAGDLPFGDQKALELARAVASRPRLLLLDEPMAGLSEEEAERMIGLLQRVAQRDMAVVLIEHHLSVVSALCQKVLVLHHGRQLAFGPLAEVFAEPAVRELYRKSAHGSVKPPATPTQEVPS